LEIRDLEHIKNMAVAIENTISVMKKLEELGESFLTEIEDK
jgi:hypothetical protein